MAFPDTAPRKGDSDNNLLFKIAQELSEQNGGAFPPMLGDSDNILLRKILQLIILGGTGGGGTCPADLAACNAALAVCQAQVIPQDMQVAWTPTSSKLGEDFGFTTADINYSDITGITFKGASSKSGFVIASQSTLTSLSFPNLVSSGTAGGTSVGIGLTNNSALPSVSFPVLTTVSGASPSVNIITNALLASAGFPALKTSIAINITGNPALTSLSFPALTSMGGGSLTVTGNTVMSAFSAASLTTLGNNLSLGTNVGLVSISFPVLATTTGSMVFSGNTSLTALSFPNLISIGASATGITATGCAAMTTFSFPLLTAAGRLLVDGCTNLANVTLTNYLPTNGRVQNFSNAALTQASVDHVLARCVANAAYVSGTITLNGGTSSTPSAAGLVDKATLQARGCVVNTN